MTFWTFFETYISYNPDQRLYFVLSLFCSEAVVFIRERKQRRGLCFLPAAAVYFLFGVFFPECILPSGNFVSFLIVVVSVLLALWSLKIPFAQILFSCIGAYAVQNLSANVSQIALILFEVETIWGFILTSFVCTAVIIVAFYLLAGRKFKGEEVMNTRKIALMVLSLSVVLVANVFMWIFRRQGLDKNIYVRLLVTLSILLVLFLQYNFYENGKIAGEKETVEKLLQAEQRQYRVSQEAVDLINRKCHDLKNQMLLLKRSGGDGSSSAEIIGEAEELLDLYDTVFQTGNEVLDGILTEKGIRCKKNGIEFSCIADGALVRFMKDVDLYSFLGNILDNAIESSLKETEGRQISLKIASAGSFCFVHADNYCPKAPVFAGGLPVSDKRDNENHGFGVKSIVYLAEKYGGRAVFSYADKRFEVDVLFPKN